MTKGLIASVLALSLAFTSVSATPVRAGSTEEDIAKFLFGLATIAVIGKAINDNNNRPATRPSTPARTPRVRPIPRSQRVLPAECQYDVRARRHTTSVLGERCLNRNYRHADRLPQQCKIEVETRRGRNISGFSPECLQRRGFRVARTR